MAEGKRWQREGGRCRRANVVWEAKAGGAEEAEVAKPGGRGDSAPMYESGSELKLETQPQRQPQQLLSCLVLEAKMRGFPPLPC